VRAFFQAGGSALVQVEIDPRCFEADPEAAPYLFLGEYLAMHERQRIELRSRAILFTNSTIDINLHPGGAEPPEWSFEFTAFSSGTLSAADDPVVLTGSWRVSDVTEYTGYQIHSSPDSRLAVLFLNYYEGELLKDLQVLFPGESSDVLNLARLDQAETGDPNQELFEGEILPENRPVFQSFFRAGFRHVLPSGADHLLFLLGLALLVRTGKQLAIVVATFALSHAAALGLALAGVIHIPQSAVEPVSAASIGVIAIGNVARRDFSNWRLAVVFIFGLAHSLGFAGALSDLEMPKRSLATGLAGFNIGVDAAHLAALALILLATLRLRNAPRYREFIVIPASLAIAATGLYWIASNA
jgi:hypothetical protein